MVTAHSWQTTRVDCGRLAAGMSLCGRPTRDWNSAAPHTPYDAFSASLADCAVAQAASAAMAAAAKSFLIGKLPAIEPCDAAGFVEPQIEARRAVILRVRTIVADDPRAWR